MAPTSLPTGGSLEPLSHRGLCPVIRPGCALPKPAASLIPGWALQPFGLCLQTSPVSCVGWDNRSRGTTAFPSPLSERQGFQEDATLIGKCAQCGNDYDKSFEVRMDGRTMIFDSFETKRPQERGPEAALQTLGF